MISSDRDRPDAGGAGLLVEALDQVQRLVLRHRVDRRVPQIGHLAEVVGLHPRRRMRQPDQPRGLPHRRRPITRPGSVVQPQIEGHADQPDIDLRIDPVARHPQESRHIGEPRHLGRIDRAEGLGRHQAFGIVEAKPSIPIARSARAARRG